MNRVAFAVGTGGLLIAFAFASSDVPEPETPENGFTPITWNADQRINDDGSLTTNFTTGWVNYFDGEWKKITPRFVEGDDGFSITEAPYYFHAPKILDTFTYINNNKFDPDKNAKNTEPPVTKAKTFTAAHSVTGVSDNNGLLYENAFDFGDLRITATQESVSYVAVFNEEPAGDEDIHIPFSQVILGAESVRDLSGRGVGSVQKNTGSGIVFGEKRGRQIFTRQAFVWDSEGRTMPIAVLTRKIGGAVISTKVIPRSFLRNATYPVYTEATDAFTADTADRGMTSDSGDFATYRAGNNLTLETANNVNLFAVNWLSGGTTYFGYRSYLWWATGTTIPSGNTITAATLTVNYPNAHAAISRTTYLVENRQAADTLATSDWTLIGESGVGTGTGQPYASITRTSGEAAGDKVFTINATGLLKIAKGSGNTYFATVSAYDWDNSAPPNESTTGSNYKSSDNAANKPTLSVTHSAPSSQPKQLFYFM